MEAGFSSESLATLLTNFAAVRTAVISVKNTLKA
jgi:hypothetical protein